MCLNVSSECVFFLFNRLASNNNMSKSESDQEDNDDLNDNDWSYGAEKKGQYFKVVPKQVVMVKFWLLPHVKGTPSFCVTAKKRKSDKVMFDLAKSVYVLLSTARLN